MRRVSRAAGGPVPPMARCAARLLALTVLLLATGLSRSAAGYVRYETGLGAPYAWFQSRVRIEGYPQDLENMTREQMRGAMQAAVAAWDRRAPGLGGCSYLELDFSVADASRALDATVTAPVTANDQRNVVVMRTDVWGCDPTSGAQATPCYDPNALALTTLTTLKKTGEILDADIEINGVDDVWGDLTVVSIPHGQDVQNALTHEMGHFIGLDHPCYLGQAPDPLPLDDTGAPTVNCRDAPASVRAATMFPSSTPGDLGLRTLSPDDFAAVCDIYALGRDPHDYSLPANPAGCACRAADPGTRRGAGSRRAPYPGRQQRQDDAAGAPSLGLSVALVLVARSRRRRGHPVGPTTEDGMTAQ